MSVFATGNEAYSCLNGLQATAKDIQKLAMLKWLGTVICKEGSTDLEVLIWTGWLLTAVTRTETVYTSFAKSIEILAVFVDVFFSGNVSCKNTDRLWCSW